MTVDPDRCQGSIVLDRETLCKPQPTIAKPARGTKVGFFVAWSACTAIISYPQLGSWMLATKKHDMKALRCL